MSRTYEDALSHLASLQSNFAITSLFSPQVSAPDNKDGNGKAQDLNAVAIPEVVAWLGRAGLTPDDLCQLRCIHVAGTKGKGSVCAYLTSVLTRPEVRGVAGRVGTYTSPHLITVRERIMLDGEPIGRELFARYFFEVWDAMTDSARTEYLRQKGGGESVVGDDIEAELQGPATKPFYFRFLTILAFHAFLREGVRSAVIECGIGGEYDSTNILPAAAATSGVVAQLGIDHVGMLGGTLPEIAWHKIGIAKAGRKIFTRKLEGGDVEEEAMKVMRARAEEKGATLVEVTDAQVEENSGVSTLRETPSLAGEFQKYNRALVRAAVPEHLRLCDEQAYRSLGQDTLDQAIRHGLESAQLRGRCETREDGNITWLIDGAHTAESLHEVAKWFAGKTTDTQHSNHAVRKVLVFNQQERDVGKLLRVLSAGIPSSGSAASACPFDKAIFTRNDLQPRREGEAERDLAVQKTAAEAYESIYQGSGTTIHDNIADTIEEVRKLGLDSQQKTLVLVTGSLHLVGALLQVLEPDAPR